MLYSDEIELLTDEPQADPEGYQAHHLTTSKKVWADAHSVGRTEFYKAAAIGRQTAIAFSVHAEDYSQEPYIRFGGKVYSVLRAYQKGAGDWELTCTDVLDWGGA